MSSAAGEINAAACCTASAAVFGSRRAHPLNSPAEDHPQRNRKRARLSMGELGEKLWAVMSERGCEATRVTRAEAVEMVRRLRAEGISGLCVITEHAASHLPPAKIGKGKTGDGGDSKRPKHSAKNKAAT